MDSAPPRCAICGRSAESEPPPLTWTSGVERGQPQWLCPECSRTHLRALESKLDSDYW